MNPEKANLQRVASVLVSIGLRLVEREEEEENGDIDGGLLPRLDRGAG